MAENNTTDKKPAQAGVAKPEAKHELKFGLGGSGNETKSDGRDMRNDRGPRGGGMRRRGGRPGDRAAEGPKEFDEVTISIDRVARVVKGGRRFRFKALVAVGDHKSRIGVGVAKGQDVSAAVTKAASRAKKNMVTVPMENETIPHVIETRVTGANVLLKPATPGTGIIAGGVVRTIADLAGVKNLVSKSLGSTNKVNIAYATVESFRNLVPKDQWLNKKPAKVEEAKK